MAKNTPLLALMHDTAHDLNIIQSVAFLMTKTENLEEIQEYAKIISKSVEDCKSKLDAYYIGERNETRLTNTVAQ